MFAGFRFFTDSQPAPPIVANPGVGGAAAPAIVVELVNAMTANDTDRIRTVMTQQVFNTYAGELQRFSIATIESVETLGTYAEGFRTATMLVLHGRRVNDNPFILPLVVITENGQIVRLR
jgi:hypothetical protein